MHRRHRPLAALALALWLSPTARAQVLSPPELVGTIAGPGANQSPAGVHFYGTDLGWTFTHRGQLFMLFGDTWPTSRSLCDGLPANDDSQATLPPSLPAGVPTLTIATDPQAPAEFARIHLLRDGESLVMGYDKTPLTAFSDGTDAIGLFGLAEIVRCRSRRGHSTCRPYEHLTCTQQVGICTPSTLGFDTPCDLTTGGGCTLGEICTATPAGVCIDPDSSQSDGTPASAPFTAAYYSHFGVQDGDVATDYHDAGVIASNKFIDVTARTVRCFSGRRCGSDYGPGNGALLVWGRSGYAAEGNRQSHMYLMAHPLPIRRDAAGVLELRPWYFAGTRPGSDEPRWSRRESRRVALAMDGVAGGNPDDEQRLPNQTAVSWLGAPVNKWMMLYGGGGADYLLADPAHAHPGPAPGSIRARFADHPWGPWSPAVPHLDPGSPSVVGDPYGPGGFMFHNLCQDQGPALCAPSDPSRPPDFVVPSCAQLGKLFDVGFFYAPNVIDPYTRADGAGGLDVYWNVSIWNPYAVVLLKTNVKPAAPAATCTGKARHPPFRWCASAG